MGNLFTTDNGAKITINNLNFTGTTQTISLGQYKSATYTNYNTELNNVNVIGLEVVSLSANISPAVIVYGNATFNNVNIYNTKLSELDTDPQWTPYDLAVANYSHAILNNSRVDSIYLWKHAKLTVKAGTTVDSINVSLGTSVNNIIVEEGATVNKVITKTGEMTFAEWQEANK